jgi:hypothetical protein
MLHRIIIDESMSDVVYQIDKETYDDFCSGDWTEVSKSCRKPKKETDFRSNRTSAVVHNGTVIDDDADDAGEWILVARRSKRKLKVSVMIAEQRDDFDYTETTVSSSAETEMEDEEHPEDTWWKEYNDYYYYYLNVREIHEDPHMEEDFNEFMWSNDYRLHHAEKKLLEMKQQQRENPSPSSLDRDYLDGGSSSSSSSSSMDYESSYDTPCCAPFPYMAKELVEDLGYGYFDKECMVEAYRHHLETEAQRSVLPLYMEEFQPQLNERMRTSNVGWLVIVHARYKLVPETLYLAVNLMDRILECRQVHPQKLQLVCAASLYIASKYEDIYHPFPWDLVYLCGGKYTESQVRFNFYEDASFCKTFSSIVFANILLLFLSSYYHV